VHAFEFDLKANTLVFCVVNVTTKADCVKSITFDEKITNEKLMALPFCKQSVILSVKIG
jgi:hypothetical protein